MKDETLFYEPYIFTDMRADSRDALLAELGGRLMAGGFVKDSFVEAIIRRENLYPTGLPTESLKIAVPHTDVDHVEKPCICIAKLAEPVAFKVMGDNHTDIAIDMVFMLALNDPKAHLDVLQKVIQLFSDKAVLAALKEARTARQIYAVVVRAVNRL